MMLSCLKVFLRHRNRRCYLVVVYGHLLGWWASERTPFHPSPISQQHTVFQCRSLQNSADIFPHTHRHLTHFAWTPVLLYCLKKWLAIKGIRCQGSLSNSAQGHSSDLYAGLCWSRTLQTCVRCTGRRIPIICLQTRHCGQRPKIPQIPK